MRHRKQHLRTSRRGFSLVELVIVVVIIGVIAGIAVPRISRASRGSSDAAVRRNLQALRSAISYFSAQHNGLYPGQNGTSGQFWNQLTLATKINGDHTGPNRTLGPYLRNPIKQTVGPSIGETSILFSNTSPPTVVESPPNFGWVYNNQTGEILANTDDLDDTGVGYNTY